MRPIAFALTMMLWTGSLALPADDNPQPVRRLALREYRDKMKAGWLGQMVGVAWGAPTEFKWLGRRIPAAEIPPWKDGVANEAFSQDDLYVEMTFLRTLEQYGWTVSSRQAGIDFANSQKRPRRYHGAVTLDATRVGRDASRVAEEVISHLAGLVGANVRVTLEIQADIPSGAPENVVRTVTENGRTLKFTSQGFEND